MLCSLYLLLLFLFLESREFKCFLACLLAHNFFIVGNLVMLMYWKEGAALATFWKCYETSVMVLFLTVFQMLLRLEMFYPFLTDQNSQSIGGPTRLLSRL